MEVGQLGDLPERCRVSWDDALGLNLDAEAACRDYDYTKANELNALKWVSWNQACSLVLEHLLGMSGSALDPW